jgi:polyphosphate kinase 2 (PPK2 family)
VPPLDDQHVLRALATPRSITKKVYEDELLHWQGEIAQLVRSKKFAKRSLVTVFEGVDAAGKGGAIRRLTAALDPRAYDVIPIAAPTDEEKAHPYMWRFWRHLPPRGKVLVFDRSWYGRVLVERVEGYCTSRNWLRAYGEINDFEEQLHDHGAILVKVWLHIDAEEQLRRFQAREQEAHKRWKIGPDDWRNRDKWQEYELAVNDMVDRTSTEFAPWSLISANDKHAARIEVLRTIAERMKAELKIT